MSRQRRHGGSHHERTEEEEDSDSIVSIRSIHLLSRDDDRSPSLLDGAEEGLQQRDLLVGRRLVVPNRRPSPRQVWSTTTSPPQHHDEVQLTMRDTSGSESTGTPDNSANNRGPRNAINDSDGSTSIRRCVNDETFSTLLVLWNVMFLLVLVFATSKCSADLDPLVCIVG